MAMKREDDEQLWDLLGRGADPKVSPFFARNILRQIRQEPRWSVRMRLWLAPRRLIPASGAALAVIAALILTSGSLLHRESPDTQIDPVIAKIDAQDYEVVADLDNLLASDENSPWDEDSKL
jgi:hypothetical protein